MGSLFGKSHAGERAAEAERAAAQLAIDEQRRQFDVTNESFQPYVQAGAAALPGVVQGTTAAGLDQRLADIYNTDVFGSLVDQRQRAVQSQLGASGLMRSGSALKAAANIPTEIGLAIEELLAGRTANLAGLGQNAVAGLGGLGNAASGMISQLLQGQGQSTASGILADQQSRAQGFQNILGLGALIPAASMSAGMAGIAGFFSDPRLKENAEKISEIGNLSLWEWDWIAETKGTLVEGCPNIGFMADEVAEKYPHHVGEFGGFSVINYQALLAEVENKYGNTIH